MMRSAAGGVPRALVRWLAAVSILENAASLITIPTESLWPVRMVARELAPWFVPINLLGIALTLRRSRLALASFAVGLGTALWPIAQLPQVRADVAAQWREQRFAGDISFVGPADALVNGFSDLVVTPVQPVIFSPTLHLYRAAAYPVEERLPTIIDIHGGSWQVGGVREDAVFASRMAEKGYAVFAVDYRKAPRFTFPAQLEDVQNAIAWVRDNAARVGGNPDRIALVGRSAGGHLAMLAAYAGDAGPIRSVVNIYGPGDLIALYEHPPSPDPLSVRSKLEALLGATPSVLPDGYRSASPVNHLRAGLPPTLLIQGGSDHVVERQLTRELHSRLLASGSRSLLLEIPWADHSFDFVHFGPSNTMAQSVIEAFLADTLRAMPVSAP